MDQLIQDLIAHEEWAIDYHTKSLLEAKIKLNSLKAALEGKKALDIDKMLQERNYHA